MIAKLRKSLWPPIVLAVFLAGGLIAAWAIAGGFIYSTIPTTPVAYETLQITPTGEVLIAQLRPGTSYYTYRTLDGQEFTKPTTFHGEYNIGLVNLPYPGKQWTGPNWSRLVVGLAETGTPPNFWYLVHDNQVDGHVYLVGYNSESKQLIGYIGQKGFRSDLPPADEQFPIDRSSFVSGSSYCGGGYYVRPGNQPSVSPYNDASSGAIFVASEGKLWRISLTKRSAEILPLFDDVLALSSTHEQLIRTAGNVMQATTEIRIAVRTKHKVVLLNQYGKQTHSLRIPERFLREPIQLTHWWTKEPIYVVDYWSRKGPPEVFWFDSDGTETKHVTVPLARYAGESPQSTAWTIAVFCPAPLIVAVFFAFIMPVTMAANSQSGTFAAAFGESVAAGWPAFLAVCLVSLAMSVVCYRRHRKQSESGATAWAVFVLLAGPAGYFGYLLHRRWVAKETCQNCHEVSPRDRNACLHCNTVFPPPAVKGIEILA